MKQPIQLRKPGRFLPAVWLIAAIIATALPTSGQTLTRPWQAGSSIVVPEGRSIMLHFDKMRRVQIANPEIADVIISSVAQLVVYGNKRGVTTLYVWDRTGLHEYEVTVTGATPAEKAARELQKALGDKLIYTTVGENILIVEGTVDQREFLQRVHRIIAAHTGPVSILDLVSLTGAPKIPAEAAAAAFTEIFGDKLEYRVLDVNSLVVQGDLNDPAEVEHVASVVAATSSDELSILNLVKYNDELASPPLDKLRQAVGPELKVWQVKGRTVAVDGKLTSQDDYDRLVTILQSFADQANIINLVRVIEPRPEIDAYAQQLRDAFGPDVEVKQIGPETLALLQARVMTQETREDYEKILTTMDHPYRVLSFLPIGKSSKDQIEVAVLVVEISNDELDKLGIEWGQLGATQEGVVGFLSQPFLYDIKSINVNDYDPVADFAANVHLLLEDSSGRVLSRPRIMVNDGEEAEILVGGEVPIPIIQPTSGGVTTVTIEYKKYGIRLQITPTIKSDGRTLELEIQPEVSSLDWANGVTISGFNIPALRMRSVQTTVSIQDGGTLALGGLLQKEQAEIIRKIPLISEIPIIGELFKHKSFTSGSSELVIFVTPRIATATHYPPGYEHPARQELESGRQIPE